MPHGQVLEFSGATKRFGAVTAVSDFTARVEPGVVTGFLGPNGAGKTTSLRMLLGLVRPTSGTATIDGVRYAKLKNPLQTVGAVLEASSFHPGRTGAAHLTVYARAAGIPKTRVDEVLGLVGLADAAGRKVGGYSLGMRQRLGLAYALLGDPGALVLDEPTNGLDPEGIKWIRGFLRQLAREGRTVLVSSHLLTEVQQTVDSLLIISAGRLVFQGGLDELADPSEQATVVDSADRAALAEALRAAGIPFEVLRSGLTVRGIEPVSVGLAAAAAGVPLSALHKRGPALEEVFLDLVNGTRVHASASGALADVIPAIESGAIAVAQTAEEPVDAAAAAAPEGEDLAPEAAPVVEEAPAADAPQDDALPEATPEDTESIAEEIEAAGIGAGSAAGMGAAAGMAWAEADEARDEGEDPPAEPLAAEAEPEPEPAGEAAESAEPDSEPVPGPAEPDSEPEPEPGPESAEPSTRTASFAVASTGVIDIVPVDDSEDSETGSADAEPEAEDEAEAEPAHSDDRPWDEYVRTDADEDADRFFAAFDAETGEGGDPQGASVTESADDEARELDAFAEGGGAEEDGSGGDAASDSPDPGDQTPQPPEDGGHDDHSDESEGGEHR